jgi:ABC-type dipeptide/oligopeptide/nickel transport system ATPase component
VISQNVDRMLVMYGGSVVESGPTASVFAAMAHPYTGACWRRGRNWRPEQRSPCGYRPLPARCPSW